MKIDPEKYTDHIVSLQKKISAAKQDVELSKELAAKTTDEKAKKELQDKAKRREQEIGRMNSEIGGTIESRARDSHFTTK